MLRFSLATIMACLATFVAPTPRAAAQVTMIIPFPAGGATDLMGRLIQPELSAALGVQVVIRNVGGASGVIGATEAARARPDGATLFLTPVGPVAIQPHMRANPSYRADSFAPICQVTDSPVVMMTPKASGLRTLDDVLARARAAGGTYPYGSSGIGTIPHISMVALARSAGVPMLHVPFRGSADVMHAFAQGTVALFNDQAILIRQYDLHAIASLTEARVPDFPDAPTMRELGHDLVFGIWSGIYAPAGTPPEMVARVEAACRRTMETSAVREGLQRIAQPVRFRGSRDFAAFTRDESEKFRTLIDAAGMRQAE